MKSHGKFLVRTLFSLLFLAGGVIIATLAERITAVEYKVIVAGLGTAFIVTGMVSLFQELVLSHFSHSEAQELAEKMVNLIHRGEEGIRIIKKERAGFSGYHKWTLQTDAREMFFAGRSALHRMKKDFKDRPLNTVAEAFVDKMKRGSHIKILFMDPTWEMVDQIAITEGRKSPAELYSDIGQSLEIVHEIFQKLKAIEATGDDLPGSIEIRLSSNSSQFAYHCIKSLANPDSDVETYIGFYFAGKMGWETPVFSIPDKVVRSLFESHLLKHFEYARPLLNYPAGRNSMMTFDDKFYEDCKLLISKKSPSKNHQVSAK